MPNPIAAVGKRLRRPVSPPLHAYLGGVMATSTDRGPGPVQQDVGLSLSLPGAKVIIVADGVTALRGSDRIAAVAVLTAATTLRQLVAAGYPVHEPMLRYVIADSHAASQRENAILRSRGEAEGGTTLLIGVETDDAFSVAAVGDGCVVFIDGDRPPIGNILAHSPMRDCLGSDSKIVAPTLVTFPKTSPEGHCLFLATDGIATRLDGDPAATRSELTTIRYLTQGIKAVLADLEWSPRDIQEVLDAWTQERAEVLGRNGEIRKVDYSDDNRTVGVLIDETFIQTRQARGTAPLPQ